MRKSLFVVLLLIIVLAAAMWLRDRDPQGPRAIFLIVVDTLRPDRLSCYGYQEHDTPNIDGLAASGTRFKNANAPGSWTVPSMGSILTSLYPSQLGLIELPAQSDSLEWRERREQLSYMVPDAATTIAEVLSEHGFRSGAFVNQPALNHKEGYVQGFDFWAFPLGTGAIERVTKDEMPISYGLDAFEGAWKDQWLTDIKMVDEMEEWLKRHSKKRVFVWLHLLAPHAPYQPPRRYIDPQRREPSNLYDAEVRLTDELMGRVLQVIDKSVGRDQSLIVFTSDHGEEFGERNMFEHGHSLHSEVMQVPLIIAGPGFPPNASVDAFVSTIDIAPTLLEQMRVDDMDITNGMAGWSLTRFLFGGESDEFVYAEGMLYGSTERSLIHEGHKLMFDAQAQSPRLYDVRADAGETDDHADYEADRVARMVAEIQMMDSQFQAYRTTSFPEVADTLVSDEDRERIHRAMRALGYVND